MAKRRPGPTARPAAPLLRVPAADKILATLHTGHPRLFLNAVRLECRKRGLDQDATLGGWYAILKQDADAALTAETPKFVVAASTLDLSRTSSAAWRPWE